MGVFFYLDKNILLIINIIQKYVTLKINYYKIFKKIILIVLEPYGF